MENKETTQQIEEINRKLDLILEEIELQRRHRREMEELKEDLFRVGKDLYNTAVEELEEVHDHFQTGDILHLGKKLLRNVNNLNKAFDQLESTRDFLRDASPLIRESVIDLMDKLDEYDRKGYFQFMKELGRVLDRIVTSFTPDDVKALGDNIVTILNTVRNLTQPDMLHAINNAVSVYNKLDIEVEEKISYYKLFKELNTPEMRRGLSFAIKFLKSIAAEQSSNQLVNINNLQTN